jgi:sterol desaturase/sphingolipid hydroxylase (fatty acid hydroxylase superfamily)
LNILVGVFFVLHGLVHLLYAGQSLRFFELRPGMTWPDDSWLFSKLLGDPATRTLCAVLLGLVTLGFLASGLGLFIRQDWWRPVTIATVGFSSFIFLLFWDGRFQSLDDKGGVGLLINLVILVVVLVLKLPV